MQGWQLQDFLFCQLANMHICVSSFIADTEQQVLIYCSSNNGVGMNTTEPGEQNTSLKIFMAHLYEHTQYWVG